VEELLLEELLLAELLVEELLLAVLLLEDAELLLEELELLLPEPSPDEPPPPQPAKISAVVAISAQTRGFLTNTAVTAARADSVLIAQLPQSFFLSPQLQRIFPTASPPKWEARRTSAASWQ
jgi:hypothetical protein